MTELEKKAILLRQIEKTAIQFIAEGRFEDFIKSIYKLREIKEEIKLELIDNPIVTIKDKEAEKTIKIINENKELPLEKCCNGTLVGDILKDEFSDDELSKIGSDIFYSWYSHYEYINGLSKIGSLILNSNRLPKYLNKFTDEARQCFAFQQYNAVFSLCRTMLEVTVKELCINNGILPKDSNKLKQLENYKTSLNYLIEELTKLQNFMEHNTRLHWVRRRTNFVVHGNKSASESDALEIIKETFNTLGLLLKNQ